MDEIPVTIVIYEGLCDGSSDLAQALLYKAGYVLQLGPGSVPIHEEYASPIARWIVSLVPAFSNDDAYIGGVAHFLTMTGADGPQWDYYAPRISQN